MTLRISFTVTFHCKKISETYLIWSAAKSTCAGQQAKILFGEKKKQPVTIRLIKLVHNH